MGCGGRVGWGGGMWKEVVGASLWISIDLQWIWVDFLHVDSHLYLQYLQNISKIFQANIVEACSAVVSAAAKGWFGVGWFSTGTHKGP